VKAAALCSALAHPAVAQAAVVGAAAGEQGEAIVAFVVPKPAVEISAEALQAHCRAHASSYKVPDHIEIRAALPVTETGKLFRRALKEEAARRSTRITVETLK
jgi:long-chain acyl-CoA synthetase